MIASNTCTARPWTYDTLTNDIASQSPSLRGAHSDHDYNLHCEASFNHGRVQPGTAVRRGARLASRRCHTIANVGETKASSPPLSAADMLTIAGQ